MAYEHVFESFHNLHDYRYGVAVLELGSPAYTVYVTHNYKYPVIG